MTTIPAPWSNPARQNALLWLTAAFVTCLIIANVTGSKFFHFGTINIFGTQLHVEHSVGMLCFPVTFILTDIINDFYGPKGARQVTYIGLVCSLLAGALLWMATHVPPAPPGRSFVDEAMFGKVLGASGLMIIASMCAYVVGQLADIAVVGFFKRLTGGKAVWLRATGSTVISQLLDSFTIMLVLYTFSRTADGQRQDFNFVLSATLKGYAIKFGIAVLTTPVLYALRGVLQNWLGLTPMPAPAKA